MGKKSRTQQKPKSDPRPPLPGPEIVPPKEGEVVPTVVVGYAARIVTIVHGKNVASQTTEPGITWTCPKCKDTCQAFGNELRDHIVANRSVQVYCTCGQWGQAVRPTLSLAAGVEPKDLIRDAIQAAMRPKG